MRRPWQYADSRAAAVGVAGALPQLLHAGISPPSSKAHGCSNAVVSSMASTSLCIKKGPLVPQVPQRFGSPACLVGAAAHHGDELRYGRRLRRLGAGALYFTEVGATADGDCGADGILQQLQSRALPDSTHTASPGRQYPTNSNQQKAIPNQAHLQSTALAALLCPAPAA